jgi:multiple sugar transport system substrate-binding protein
MRARARIASTTALAALAAFALTACTTAAAAPGTGGAPDPGTGGAPAPAAGSLTALGPDEQVDIVFESYNLGQGGLWADTINGLIADFEDEHPNIHVVGQASQSTSTAASVQQQLLAGTVPDVAQITFDALAYSISDLGAVNLTQLVGTDALAANFAGQYPFHPRAAVLADLDGATYGIPYVFSTPVLWVNDTLLRAAGIAPATLDVSSWEKLTAAAERVTAHTGKPSVSISCIMTGGNWCMQSLFRSGGAQVLSDDRTTIEFGSDAAIATVQTFRDMYDAGVLANEDNATQPTNFVKGDAIAFHVNTSVYQSTYIGGAAANGGWELAARHLPGVGANPAVPTNSGSALVMFTQDPKHQAAAWEFMQFFTSAHAYEQISTKIGYVPLRPSLTAPGGPLAQFLADNPLIQPNLDQLDTLAPWVAYPGPNYIQVDTILYPAIENAIFNGADPATELRDVAQRAQGLLQ